MHLQIASFKSIFVSTTPICDTGLFCSTWLIFKTGPTTYSFLAQCASPREGCVLALTDFLNWKQSDEGQNCSRQFKHVCIVPVDSQPELWRVLRSEPSRDVQCRQPSPALIHLSESGSPNLISHGWDLQAEATASAGSSDQQFFAAYCEGSCAAKTNVCPRA